VNELDLILPDRNGKESSVEIPSATGVGKVISTTLSGKADREGEKNKKVGRRKIDQT